MVSESSHLFGVPVVQEHYCEGLQFCASVFATAMIVIVMVYACSFEVCKLAFVSYHGILLI